MTETKYYSFDEASKLTGLERSKVMIFVHQEWIQPPEADFFDDEDIARIRLILELRDRHGVNDEAIPIILHLTDQLYFLRNRLHKAFPLGLKGNTP